MNAIIKNLGKPISGEIKIPGDKSISIRAVLISSFFYGDFDFENFNFCDDTKAAINCMDIIAKETSKPTNKIISLDCKNSGTTMRLLAGLLCGMYNDSPYKFKLIGDKSLNKRPMERIIAPLKKMGFDIESKNGGNPPLYINCHHKHTCKCSNHNHIKHNFSYTSNISSAQVKSCLEIASFCQGIELTYKEPYLSRNHTKIMLHYFKHLKSNSPLPKYKYFIPSDFSTAAYFLANTILYGKNITMKNICINPTRIGFLKCIKEMGIKVTLSNIRILQGEKIADIYYKTNISSNIKSISVLNSIIPSMIDEIPILAILLIKADGISKINGISELKVKESDRLKAITDVYDILNVKYKINKNSLTIYGDKDFDIKNISQKQKKSLESYNSKDHRILLLLKLLGAKKIKNTKYLNVSI